MQRQAEEIDKLLLVSCRQHKVIVCILSFTHSDLDTIWHLSDKNEETTLFYERIVSVQLNITYHLILLNYCEGTSFFPGFNFPLDLFSHFLLHETRPSESIILQVNN